MLFLFMFGAGWNRGGGANGEPVTEAGLCNAMNFNNLENAVGRLSDQNTQQTMQLGNGICNLGYELQGNVGQLGKEVALGQANLQMQASNNAASFSLLSVVLSATPTPPRLPLGTIRTSTLMRADAEPRSKLLPSIFGSLGRRGRKSSPPGVKGAHNGC